MTKNTMFHEKQCFYFNCFTNEYNRKELKMSVTDILRNGDLNECFTRV